MYEKSLVDYTHYYLEESGIQVVISLLFHFYASEEILLFPLLYVFSKTLLYVSALIELLLVYMHLYVQYSILRLLLYY